MTTGKTHSIAARLHCTPVSIPKEYEGRARDLAATYVKKFSLSGLYVLDYSIVYNRVCNLTHSQLTANPEFNIGTFSHFINPDTLFYSVTDIQTLALSYKTNPEETFFYIMCFFARKLVSFKRRKIAYIKGLEHEDVDQAMMIALYKVLERYNPKLSFSFTYLDLELFAAVTQLGGEMRTFSLPRNDFVNYLKFSYYIDKYKLTPENIKQFLHEINLPKAGHVETQPVFCTDEKDRTYSCKITLKKAYDYFTLYSIEHSGIICAISYDDKADMIIDNTHASIDPGYEAVELDLFARQAFHDPKEQRILYRLTQPGGTTFSSKELLEEYEYTRYALTKLKQKIKTALQ